MSDFSGQLNLGTGYEQYIPKWNTLVLVDNGRCGLRLFHTPILFINIFLANLFREKVEIWEKLKTLKWFLKYKQMLMHDEKEIALLRFFDPKARSLAIKLSLVSIEYLYLLLSSIQSD